MPYNKKIERKCRLDHELFKKRIKSRSSSPKTTGIFLWCFDVCCFFDVTIYFGCSGCEEIPFNKCLTYFIGPFQFCTCMNNKNRTVYNSLKNYPAYQ